jgi:hypothetical protein
MEQAAYVIGKTKKTIYNHKDKGKFSFELDNDGKAVIDASELLRVYGSGPEISARLKELHPEGEGSVSVITPAFKGKKPASITPDNDLKIKLVKLEGDLEKERALKDKAEDEVEYFKSALDKAQDTANKMTLMLEDKSKESKEEEWKKAMRAIEERIANQEEETKRRERLLVQKNKSLQVALEEEKNKGFFKKLFG